MTRIDKEALKAKKEAQRAIQYPRAVVEPEPVEKPKKKAKKKRKKK
jgi:hypothetical protein